MLKNWFSNFLSFDEPFEHEGLFYRTPEHFFQAMKTENRSLRREISEIKMAGDAKRRGRSLELRSDWEDVKIDVMRQALLYRFREGTGMRQRLMETTGEIVEWNSWHDKIWGKCVCEKCGGEGNNLLGKLLMEIRDSQK